MAESNPVPTPDDPTSRAIELLSNARDTMRKCASRPMQDEERPWPVVIGEIWQSLNPFFIIAPLYWPELVKETEEYFDRLYKLAIKIVKTKSIMLVDAYYDLCARGLENFPDFQEEEHRACVNALGNLAELETKLDFAATWLHECITFIQSKADQQQRTMPEVDTSLKAKRDRALQDLKDLYDDCKSKDEQALFRDVALSRGKAHPSTYRKGYIDDVQPVLGFSEKRKASNWINSRLYNASDNKNSDIWNNIKSFKENHPAKAEEISSLMDTIRLSGGYS